MWKQKGRKLFTKLKQETEEEGAEGVPRAQGPGGQIAISLGLALDRHWLLLN